MKKHPQPCTLQPPALQINNPKIPKGIRILSARNLSLALAICSSFAIVSCNKDLDKQVLQTGMSQSDAKALSGRITGFYEQMKSLKGGHHSNAKTTSGFGFTIDSAAFLLEATYNMYTVNMNDSDVSESITFTINEPISSGIIDESEVADAFWRIKDSLMTLYTADLYLDKSVTFFDLTTDASAGTSVAITVTGSISTLAIGKPSCPGAFSDPTSTISGEHAWAVTGANSTTYSSKAGTFSYGKGQCDVLSGTSITNTDYTYGWDAPTMLRSYGKANFLCNTVRGCGYYVNITTANTSGRTLNSLTSPTSSYVSATPTIKGYNNEDIFRSLKFYDLAGYLNDIQEMYKDWITTSMMNFYLDETGTIISSYIPGGKDFYDFNVQLNQCVCPPQINPDYPNEKTHAKFFVYHVSSGEYVPYCGGGIDLPNL